MADNKLFSVNSEIAVLSMILKHPDLIHSTGGLVSYMFSAVPHVNLYEEMQALAEEGYPADPSLIISRLESRNELDKIGGKRQIEDLLKMDTNEETFDEFIKIIIDSYKGRSLLSIVSGIRKEGLNAGNIDQVIASARSGLNDLIEMRSGDSTVHVSDIAKETYEEILARTKKQGIRGASWGIPRVDTATGGKSPGDLVIIAARPSIGKTSVACNSILQDGLNGIPALMISREMRPQELMERLICIHAGIPSSNMRIGLLSDKEITDTYNSLEVIRKLPIYIDFNFRMSDPFYLESTVNKFHNKKGVKVVYVDYLQILAERDEGQTQEIGRITRMFKQMSNDLGICSVLLSQLNRNVEMRDDKRPMLSDMRQSGSIEEDADLVIGLYRDEYYNKETKNKGLMEYLILKNRNGPSGTATVRFDGPTYTIKDY